MMCLLWFMSLQCPTLYSAIKFFFSEALFHSVGNAMFHNIGNNRYESSGLFDFRVIFFWNNFDMVCLWWYMSLQCHTFYSPIKFLSRRCVS